MRLRLLVLIFASVAALSSLPTAAPAESQTAVVNGISKLFVRRGPGMQFPPFASLSEGSVVEIQSMEGQWARIGTANGQVGYVQRRYLETGRGETAPSPTKAAATVTRRARTPSPTRTTARAASPSPRRSAVPTATIPAIATITPTRTVTAAVTATSVPPTATVESGEDSGADGERDIEQGFADSYRSGSEPREVIDNAAIHRELQTLRIAVERLQRRLDEHAGLPTSLLPDAGDLSSESASISGGAVLLALIGAVGGWFLGSNYTRKQERGRRSRIRF
ncbi:MAG TPA: SH3 domain-containing protein [Terriglobales bacterium]|nr:SH3 domain-containing protein [Terriglobales bacterium]